MIAIEMPEIVSLSELAGGSEITSYNLEFNNGAGTVFTEVVGQTVEQLQRVIQVNTTPGTTYLFRYRVKNMLGFSTSYSPEAEVKSAKAPNEPLSAATSIAGKNLKIEWVPGDENYDTVSRYEIEIRTAQSEWV